MKSTSIIGLLLLLVASVSSASDEPVTTISAPPVIDNDHIFGDAVAYAHPWLIVGTPPEDYEKWGGRVFIYRETSHNTFELVQMLGDASTPRDFGDAVAIVETESHFVLATGEAASIHIYATPVEDDAWTHVQTLDGVNGNGLSLDISRDRLIVGLPSSSRVRIYAATTDTGTPHYDLIKSLSGFAGRRLGEAVAIGFSDVPGAERYLYAIGSPMATLERGSVALYDEEYGPAPNPVNFVGYTDTPAEFYVRFGSALDMDGELLIVGIPHWSTSEATHAGAVEVFEVIYSESGFEDIQSRFSWAAKDDGESREEAYAYFGSSVAIKRSGNDNHIFTAISGAPLKDGLYHESGAAYVMDVNYSEQEFRELRNTSTNYASREGFVVALTGPFHESGHRAITSSPEGEDRRVQFYEPVD